MTFLLLVLYVALAASVFSVWPILVLIDLIESRRERAAPDAPRAFRLLAVRAAAVASTLGVVAGLVRLGAPVWEHDIRWAAVAIWAWLVGGAPMLSWFIFRRAPLAAGTKFARTRCVFRALSVAWLTIYSAILLSFAINYVARPLSAISLVWVMALAPLYTVPIVGPIAIAHGVYVWWAWRRRGRETADAGP